MLFLALLVLLFLFIWIDELVRSVITLGDLLILPFLLLLFEVPLLLLQVFLQLLLKSRILLILFVEGILLSLIFGFFIVLTLHITLDRCINLIGSLLQSLLSHLLLELLVHPVVASLLLEILMQFLAGEQVLSLKLVVLYLILADILLVLFDY